VSFLPGRLVRRPARSFPCVKCGKVTVETVAGETLCQTHRSHEALRRVLALLLERLDDLAATL
jgi:hypothetical protein